MDSKQVTETVVIAPSKGSVEDLPEFNEVNRRRVLRKLDLSILPVLAVMYFCAYVLAAARRMLMPVATWTSPI